MHPSAGWDQEVIDERVRDLEMFKLAIWDVTLIERRADPPVDGPTGSSWPATCR